MARALDQIHDKCVLVADIATRNFLLDSELSIRVCDFTGERCGFDLFKHNAPDDGRPAWPLRADLPRLEGVWLGAVIEKCWTMGGYQNDGCLLQALSRVGFEVEGC